MKFYISDYNNRSSVLEVTQSDAQRVIARPESIDGMLKREHGVTSISHVVGPKVIFYKDYYGRTTVYRLSEQSITELTPCSTPVSFCNLLVLEALLSYYISNNLRITPKGKLKFTINVLNGEPVSRKAIDDIVEAAVKAPIAHELKGSYSPTSTGYTVIKVTYSSDRIKLKFSHQGTDNV